MRSYSGLLVLEQLFDTLNPDNSDVATLAGSIFRPNIVIVETDCRTTLGKFETVNYEIEGLTELSTDEVLSRARIDEILGGGTYNIATRHTSTCISKDGICKKCYEATYPKAAQVNVQDRVTVYAEFIVNNQVIQATPGVLTYTLDTNQADFDQVYVFSEGLLLTDTQYTISGNTFTLTNPVLSDVNIVVRPIRIDLSPFLVWLAGTYAGALLGMKPLPTQKLPLRSLFLTSLLSENRLQSVIEIVKEDQRIPTVYSAYAEKISDRLERALFLLALYGIYQNVTS